MKQKHRSKPKEHLQIAKERIAILFKQAKEVFKEDPKLSDRYIELIRKLANKYKVPLTSTQKRKFCKHCLTYLVPSVNCRVRTRDGKLIYYCLKCKKYTRIPYKIINKEKNKKKQSVPKD